MSKQDLLLIGVGLAFIVVYLLQATGVLSAVSLLLTLPTAGLGILLMGIGHHDRN